MSKQLTQREQEKLVVIIDTLSGKITRAQAAAMLDISPRQVKRLKNKVREQGYLAVIHKLKGRQSNHHIEESVKEQALTVIKEQYSDFKPTFATEKLEENHDIYISRETTRRWMTKEGLWKPRKQKQSSYRSWRPRKDYYGELQQFDGSYHHWFEKRYCDINGDPIEVCLLASIDDASGKITKAVFAANEGVEAVFTFWKEYIESMGKPLAIYLDRFSTYKINHKAAVDNKELMTQFQRAMQVLGIQLITAHSPEAKGRVERLFGTLQDRLVKEMRLAQINTPKQGNSFLKEVFMPQFNNRFAVSPQKEGDVHKSLSKIDKKNINRIFSIQAKRRVNNDFTIQFKNKWYQLTELQPVTIRARDKIIVEEWLDGAIHFFLKEKYLSFVTLEERPKKVKSNPTILTSHRLNWKPPANHPWKRAFKTRY
jgi:transposase